MEKKSQGQSISNYLASSLLSVPIEHMNMSRRTKNALIRGGLETGFDIQRAIETNSLTSIRNVGELTLNEIEGFMNSLLESLGAGLRIDEVNLFVNDESEITIIPTTLYDDLPIDILVDELGSDLIRRLKSVPFEKVGDLLKLSHVVTSFTQNVSISLGRLIKYQKDILQENITIGKLHPQAQFQNKSIHEWLSLTPENHGIQLEFLKILAQANKFDSLSEELSILFANIPERNIKIYINYFNERLTLEQVGKQQGITRERVRQITSIVASKIWGQINQRPGIYFQSALLFARNMGDQLSLQSWKQLLQNKLIIESYPIQEYLDSFDALCALIRSSDKAKSPPILEIDQSIIFILDSQIDLPLGIIRAIEEMPSKAKRKVRRQISYVGGIHIIEASELLEVAPIQSANILQHLGYREVVQDWYTIASGNFTSRWPIMKAGLAMMEACGPLEFDLFCDGIRRYISRFYDVLAPPKVMNAHLAVLGFVLEDEFVNWYETPSGFLAESDECFISAIDKFGLVVTFQEVVEVFQEKGFSIATATSRVMPQSPIVERVDIGLYKIRGQQHTWEDVENARKRQETIDYNPEVTYGIDGIVRYKITIGSWALNGAIGISTSQQPLPDLGDGWEVLIGSKSYGTARRDEYLIWGLGGAFSALGVQIGDRVELAFDAWDKPVIRITKVFT